MTQIILPDFTRPAEQQMSLPLCYSESWLNVIARLYHYTVIPLTAKNAQGHLTGYLPLCLISSRLTGRRLVSLPFSDHCPLLADDDASAHDLVDQAIRLAQQQNVRYLELRTGAHDVLAQRPELREGNLYVRWLFPLTTDPEVVWSTVRKPVQHQVKKSRKLGVRAYIALRREEMADYYRLHVQTRMRQGMPAQPQRFFFALWDTFAPGGALKLLLAEYEGTVIAGMILLVSGTTVTYAYGASDSNYLHLAPNNLLLWTTIEWGCMQGYQTLDLGRTARANEGLMAFKERWGAVPEPLPYYYYPQMTGLAATSESSARFHVLTACWKHLPVQIAGPLGGILYRHLG
ncbi:MAG TPA: GNAT family N-acetyltransferase [Ktedonobacteraceae bacterium]|nr:GNAT family N-acetyltransferase [Ktedonobacteraceae bacterium]